MTSPFIVIDEIESALSSMNSTLVSKIDTVDGIVDTINTNTATNNTASNTGTLSQKLSYISNSLIGATGNTGGTTSAGTAMAKLNAILSKVNTGVSASVRGTCIKEATHYRGSNLIAAGSTFSKTIVNVTGSGTFVWASTLGDAYNYNDTGSYFYMKVTIDGTVQFFIEYHNITSGTASYYHIMSILPHTSGLIMDYTQPIFAVGGSLTSRGSSISGSPYYNQYMFTKSSNKQIITESNGNTSYTYGSRCFLDNPIRFNSSLKVEVQAYNGKSEGAVSQPSASVGYTLD